MSATCKSCGAKIEWKVLPSGKRCPMVRIKTVYYQHGDRLVKVFDPIHAAYVSHFEMCPNASQHSKRGEN